MQSTFDALRLLFMSLFDGKLSPRKGKTAEADLRIDGSGSRTDRQVDDVELGVQGRESRLQSDQGPGRFVLQALHAAPDNVSGGHTWGQAWLALCP